MAADLTMLPISSTNALPANRPPPSSLPPDRRRFHTRVLHFIRLQPRAACDTACDTARTGEEQVGSETRSVSSREKHVLIDHATSATTTHAQAGSRASVCTQARKKRKGYEGSKEKK